MTQGRTGRFIAAGVGATLSALSGCASSPDNAPHGAAAHTRLRLGLEYLARNDLDAARRNLEKALAAAPDDYRTQLGMALYEQRIGEHPAAERRYRQTLRRAPGNGDVMNNYGAFLCGLGQYVAAQRQFDAAAQLPDYRQVAQALENAGYCSLKAGRHDKARSYLSWALKYDPAKGARLLSEAGELLAARRYHTVQPLLDSYHHSLPASAESLWLQIRFAALAGHDDEITHYGDRLARSFPHSKQYQQFLANEY